jgi:serine/threonine protein phosphatase 1
MDALDNEGFEKDNPDHRIIVCGDLFDRGGQSQECWDFVDNMMKNGRLIYVRGNHEDLMQKLLHDVKLGKEVGYHHIYNGTVRTLAHLMGKNDYDILMNCFTSREFDTIYNKINEFIDTRCINYFELGDYVFVHSWLPTIKDSVGNPIKLDTNWREDTSDWYKARWGNPFEQWKLGWLPDNKTVVCGHWHTSYAHSKFHNKGTDRGENCLLTPFIDDGIIGLDGCTAASGIVNVIKFKQDNDKITLVGE